MGTLSFSQNVSLAVLSVISAVLSLIGSSTLLFAIRLHYRHSVTSRRPTADDNPTYLRLLACMSLYDLFYSVNLAMQPFLVPKESHFPMAFGNDQTCRATGTLHQIGGIGGLLYYCMLSYYYMISIRWSIRAARRCEPVMHAVAIGWSMVTGLVGAAVDWYSYLDLYPACWIANWPKSCLHEGGGECKSPLVAWLVAGDVFLFVILSLIVTNVTIYLHVRSLYKKCGSREPSSSHRFISASLFSSVMFGSNTTCNHQVNESESSLTNTGSSSQTIPRAIDGGDSQRKRTRKVASQGSLYVCAALICHLPFFLVQILEAAGFAASDQTLLLPVLVIQAFCTPLAGVFNSLIYLRPRYLKARQPPRLSPLEIQLGVASKAGLTRLEAAHMAIWGQKPSPKQTKNRLEEIPVQVPVVDAHENIPQDKEETTSGSNTSKPEQC